MAIGFRPRAALFGLQQDIYEPQPTAMQQQLQQPLPAPTPEPKKPGFFGEGGAGRAIAGYIGDALLAQSGMRPMYAPQMAEQRQLLMAQKLAESKRMADRQDFVFEQQWQRDNPKPPAPNDTERDYQFMVDKVGQGAADQWLRSRGDPMINTTLPGNRFYSGPQSGLATALGGAGKAGPQPGAVVDGFRFKGGDPNTRESWEPMSATIQNTPAPETGASGFPSVLTPQQYQAVVEAKGKAATDAWMQRNGVTVGGS